MVSKHTFDYFLKTSDHKLDIYLYNLGSNKGDGDGAMDKTHALV